MYNVHGYVRTTRYSHAEWKSVCFEFKIKCFYKKYCMHKCSFGFVWCDHNVIVCQFMVGILMGNHAPSARHSQLPSEIEICKNEHAGFFHSFSNMLGRKATNAETMMILFRNLFRKLLRLQKISVDIIWYVSTGSLPPGLSIRPLSSTGSIKLN